jgi:hypothetical protein
MCDLPKQIPQIKHNHAVYSLPVTITSKVINHFVRVSKI